MFFSTLNDVLFNLLPARPFSIIGEDFFRELEPGYASACQRAAEKLLSRPVPYAGASVWLTDPHAYFQARMDRRNMLFALMLGEAVTGTGRYAEKITDLAWAILEENTWAKAPTINCLNDPEEDEFAFETAALLAWVWHVNGRSISKLSQQVLDHMEDAVSARILAPFAAKEIPAWTQRNELRTFSRLASLLTVFLLMDTRDKRRWLGIRRILALLDSRLKELPPDGSHPAGIQAWQKDAPALSDAAYLMYLATDRRVDVRTDKKYLRFMDYPVNVHMDSGWFVNPDGAPNPALNGEILFKVGACNANAALMRLGAALGENEDAVYLSVTNRMFMGFMRKKFVAEPARFPVRKRVNLPAGKLTACAASGFHAAFSGGSRLIGHEDAGNIYITHNGSPVFFDPGAKYGRALYHSAPVIDGHGVMGGFDLAGEVEGKFEEAYTYLFANIARAFPPEVGAVSWQRTLMLSPYETRVRIVEAYDLSHPAKTITLRYVTPVRPEKTQDGKVKIGDVTFASEAGLFVNIVSMEEGWALEIPIADPGMRGTYAFVVSAV